MNRINIICLGVRDMPRAIRFYRDGLGFQTDEKGDHPQVIFFNTSGTKFELYPLDILAEDINGENPPKIAAGFAGVTLAYNGQTRDEVDRVMEKARLAGATIVKEPRDVFWGGYSGYFQDPEGYYWEVAWGPNFVFDEDGMLVFRAP